MPQQYLITHQEKQLADPQSELTVASTASWSSPAPVSPAQLSTFSPPSPTVAFQLPASFPQKKLKK